MSVALLNRLSLPLRATLQPDYLSRSVVRSIFKLLAFFSAMLPALAEPTTGSSDTIAAKASPASAFVTISLLGEAVQQAALRDGKLLTHRRATDPFGITIRGPFKALPTVVNQTPAAPAQAPAPSEQPNTTPAPPPLSQVATAVNVPTLENAIHELVIGAINLSSRQILIGSRSIHEGDLLVLQSGGGQFIVWVQSVGRGGVLFCDTDLQKHILKPFEFGPKELPTDQVWGVSEISQSLNQGVKQ
jgi:hypothetical protein